MPTRYWLMKCEPTTYTIDEMVRVIQNGTGTPCSRYPRGVRDRDAPMAGAGQPGRAEVETSMEYRQLGGSGLKVPVLSFGTGTFGGRRDFFKAWGATDVAEATRLVDICLDAGLTMFDSPTSTRTGSREEILGPGDQGPARPGAHLHQGAPSASATARTTSARRAST